MKCTTWRNRSIRQRKIPMSKAYLEFHDPKKKRFSVGQSDLSQDIKERPSRYLPMFPRMLMGLLVEVFIRLQPLSPNNLNTRRARPEYVPNHSPKLMIKSRTTKF